MFLKYFEHIFFNIKNPREESCVFFNILCIIFLISKTPERNLVLWNAVIYDDPQVGLVSANPVGDRATPVGPVELCLVGQPASLDTKPAEINQREA